MCWVFYRHTESLSSAKNLYNGAGAKFLRTTNERSSSKSSTYSGDSLHVVLVIESGEEKRTLLEALEKLIIEAKQKIYNFQ